MYCSIMYFSLYIIFLINNKTPNTNISNLYVEKVFSTFDVLYILEYKYNYCPILKYLNNEFTSIFPSQSNFTN